MRHASKSKLLRRLLTLSCLIAALFLFAASDSRSQPTYAAQCCDLCGPDYDLCMANCGGNSTCEQNCSIRLNSCNHHCVVCDGGE